MYKVVHKPWGKEEWLALNDAYCYKRIYINAGYKTSYQYHQFKQETNYIIEGTAEVWLENDEGVVEKKIMKAGEFFDVNPPKKHRVIAITDIILQEVSTPHVDDVFRINDEFNRVDGKIEAEHKTPAVLILAAGLGTRLGHLTEHINKAMLPINNKAIISHIINKFPKDYEFVVVLGYKGKELQQYCQIAYPEHKFTFVDIDNIDGENSGPGYSALKCKEYLQRPFYFITVDCLIDSKIPHLDGNWLGVHSTVYPEKYSTIKADKDGNVEKFVNKNIQGYDNAFVGLASIWDYSVFWNELQSNIENGEIVSAFTNTTNYPSLKIKQLKWLDTGNLDDLNKTRQYFKDQPLSLHKLTNEIAYKENRFLKFNPDNTFISNKVKRANHLKELIPEGFINTNNFIGYNWEPGKTLYEYNSFQLYNNFLDVLAKNISNSTLEQITDELIENFYVHKTEQRKQKFLNRFGKNYLTQEYIINGVMYPSLEHVLSTISIDSLRSNYMYSLFHGDLQFDNIVYNEELDKYTYIDWRESFGGHTEGGDLYYDLAKLYGGCIIPYNIMKQEDSINYSEGLTTVNYSYNTSVELDKFRKSYEKWILNNGYSLEKIQLITGIIFLNMSPLHEEKFAKMLWFKSLELLNAINK